MTIPVNAIDPEAEYREWVRRYEWHLDRVPEILTALLTEAEPNVPVSRGGSRFDRLQITGGGHIENIPDVLPRDQPAILDATTLWAQFVGYLEAVRAHTGEALPLTPEAITWGRGRPLTEVATRTVADQATIATGWLVDRVHHIVDWPDLGPTEDELQSTVRHLRGKWGVHSRPRFEREPCSTCGSRAVLAGWADTPEGAVKTLRCRRCGETTTPGRNEDDA